MTKFEFHYTELVKLDSERSRAQTAHGNGAAQTPRESGAAQPARGSGAL